MYVTIGSVNGLVPDGSKPLIEPMMTKNCDVISFGVITHKAILG